MRPDAGPFTGLEACLTILCGLSVLGCAAIVIAVLVLTGVL